MLAALHHTLLTAFEASHDNQNSKSKLIFCFQFSSMSALNYKAIQNINVTSLSIEVESLQNLKRFM